MAIFVARSPGAAQEFSNLPKAVQREFLAAVKRKKKVSEAELTAMTLRAAGAPASASASVTGKRGRDDVRLLLFIDCGWLFCWLLRCLCSWPVSCASLAILSLSFP